MKHRERGTDVCTRQARVLQCDGHAVRTEVFCPLRLVLDRQWSRTQTGSTHPAAPSTAQAHKRTSIGGSEDMRGLEEEEENRWK